MNKNSNKQFNLVTYKLELKKSKQADGKIAICKRMTNQTEPKMQFITSPLHKMKGRLIELM